MSYPPGPPQPEQPWQPPSPPPTGWPQPPAPPTWPQPPAPPPSPPPWGQQPPTAPMPPAAPPPSVPPAPSTVQMPPVPPGQWGPPPATPPPAKKSNVGLIIGIVVGVVLLLCVGGIIGVFALLRTAADEVGDTLSSATFPVDTPTGDPVPAGETFDMELGDGVQVVDGDTEWHVYVLDAQWFSEPCDDFGVADHPIVVLDVEFEVISGTASLNTLFDFSYVDDDGEIAAPSILSFCDEPTMSDTLDRSEGDVVTGKIAFEVPDGKGGRLEYTSDFEPTASWLIPGQNA